MVGRPEDAGFLRGPSIMGMPTESVHDDDVNERISCRVDFVRSYWTICFPGDVLIIQSGKRFGRHGAEKTGDITRLTQTDVPHQHICRQHSSISET